MVVCRRLRACAFVFVLLILVLVPTVLRAQVSSTTAAIVGTVVDSTKGVLPGVTVTVTGPALMGARTVVTDPEGAYRIPALPPGNEYKLLFELVGFQSITREGIQIGVGFTATINAEMSPAGLAENVTVSGASPVVDVTASTVTTHLNADQLASTLVGSRDYAAVMSQIPGVIHNRMDVGGSSATTMQSFRAYGVTSGRGEVEGINTSQWAPGGLLFYADMESFDDMAVSVVGTGADMSVPGSFVTVVSKSGGNAYHGQAYFDFQDESMGTRNIDDSLIARGLQGGGQVDVHDLNRFVRFRDVSANLGGFLVKDKLWWFGGLRHTRLARRYPVLIDDIAVTELPVWTIKLTYNATSNNKFTAYRSLANKIFENYGVGSRIVTADALIDEEYPNGVYSFGYEALLGGAAVLQLHTGSWHDFGDYKGKGQKQRYDDTGANRLYGSIPTRTDERGRPQANGSLTYFKDGWAGSHAFKFGGEFQHEQQKYYTSVLNNLILYLNNNVPTFVEVYQSPNRTRIVGRASSAYANDSWKLSSRMTFNLGLRFDHYRSYVPAQVGPTGHEFPEVNGPVWNNWGPRLGAVYSLTRDGKTLVKANYGKYWDSPGFEISNLFNPNPNNYFSRYVWVNPNPTYNSDGLPVYGGPQQLGLLVSTTGARPDFSPAVTPDPDLKNSYAHQSSVYFEREVAANFGVRTGFVWNGTRQGRATININQPYGAFNVPVTIPNPGPDGRTGTADDGAPLQGFNLDPAYLGRQPVQVIKNGFTRGSDFYTWEITANRRQSGRWSLLASFSHLWSREGTTVPTPNELTNTIDGRNHSREWSAKLSSTLMLARGIEVTPIFRHQAGRGYVPTFTTRLNYSSGVQIKASPMSAQRNDNVSIVDVRAQKVFAVKQKTLRVFADAYNIFNTNAVQEMTTSYGANFRRPSLITAPRIFRVGTRFEF